MTPLTPRFRRTQAAAGALPRASLRFSLLCLLLAATVHGCGTTPRRTVESRGIPLAERLLLLREAGTDPTAEYLSPRRFSLVRGGVRREGLLLVAPAAMQAPLDGIRGTIEFRCSVAPVYNIGDGMTIEILLAFDGGQQSLMRRTVDAGRQSEDRQWIPIAVPVDLPAAGDAALVIRVSGGTPGGSSGTGPDLVADWLVVAGPEVIPERHER